MHNKNEYVNYSTYGICKIEDICQKQMDGSSDRRSYYSLKPVNQSGAKIFVPVDNAELTGRMRPVPPPEEIDRIITSAKHKNMPWVNDRKQRLANFQNILAKGNEEELLSLIRCLYFRSKERASGISYVDAQILKKAENIIEQEFAFSLKISAQNIGYYIKSKFESSDEISA